ncbi:MAG: amino acid ABC transporter substrate-binding protein [Lachnospiraceae bacterium]|nr:amino acid ABC transporter substrate-binding protein [Lachnospiraceae bacterium]
MKKLIALLCAATMVATTLVGCGSKAEETAVPETAATEAVTATTEAAATETATESTSGLADKTTFTVGFDANFPPYGYMDEDGEYVGFDLDLAQEVCDRLGWELVKQPVDWDSKDMELSSGSIDCIWNGFTYNGRENDYTWSDPYIDNSQVFVVGAESGIKSASDLAGKIVDVQADSSALAALQEEDNAELAGSFGELIQVPEYNTAFMNLEAGAADAVAMDIGVANYQIASRGDKFMILDEPLSKEVYAIGFLLGNEELRDAVQEQLNAMADDGTFAKIADKWGLTDCVTMGK